MRDGLRFFPSTTTFDISWDAPESCQKLEYRLVYYPVVNRNDKKEVRNGNNRFVTLLDMQPARQYRLEIYTIAPNYQYESLPYKVGLQKCCENSGFEVKLTEND